MDDVVEDTIKTNWELWEEDKLSDEDFLDYLLNNEIKEHLHSLRDYITNTEVEYLSDLDAINLALGCLKDINAI